MLTRRTGLRRTAPLAPGGPLVARGTPGRVGVAPGQGVAALRPLRTVTAAERHAKAVVTERSGGFCEMGCGMRGSDWSHRRAAGQGGAWRPANGLRACRRCHRACEVDAPLLADLGGWRIVHRDPDPATAPVYLQAFGDRPAGWYFLTDTTDVVLAPWAPRPRWFPWMPRPR